MEEGAVISRAIGLAEMLMYEIIYRQDSTSLPK